MKWSLEMQALQRRYELYIGYSRELADKIKNEKVVTGKTENVQSSVDNRSVPPNGFVRIINNQVEVDVKFDREGSGSKNETQTIRLYNPSDKTLQYLKHGNVIVMKAGYNVDDIASSPLPNDSGTFTDTFQLPILFASDIITTSIKKTQTDRIVTITCGEAYNVRRNIKYVKTWPKGERWTYVMLDILDVLGSYGIPKGTIDPNKMNDKRLKKAKPFTGSITEALDILTKATDYSWYIAQGKINLIPNLKDKDDAGGFRIANITESMVKNTIEPMDDMAKRDLKEGEQTRKGIKFTVLLNADLSTADGINITFGDYQGKYLISKVTHKLNYEGGAWDTTVECKA